MYVCGCANMYVQYVDVEGCGEWAGVSTKPGLGCRRNVEADATSCPWHKYKHTFVSTPKVRAPLRLFVSDPVPACKMSDMNLIHKYLTDPVIFIIFVFETDQVFSFL